MSLLRLDLLSNEAIQNLSPSFDLLTPTDHKDGQYRLRRYSMVELLTEPQMFKTLPTTTFMQTSEYNDFQGNIERKFELVDEDEQSVDTETDDEDTDYYFELRIQFDEITKMFL